MARQRTQGKGCLIIAIAVLLILSILTACVVVVLNLTPNQIGLANLPIADGKSANDLEMGDSKIKEVIQLILDQNNNDG